VEVSPSGVVVSAGAKQALFNALFVLVGPGDRVMIPVPYWTSYPEIVQLARAEPLFVQGPEAAGYRVGPEELEAAWDPSVRALILNSPSNPSGSIYRRDELEAIARGLATAACGSSATRSTPGSATWGPAGARPAGPGPLSCWSRRSSSTGRRRRTP
jgi:aspartate/methionine/tyrosine aminotransferase